MNESDDVQVQAELTGSGDSEVSEALAQPESTQDQPEPAAVTSADIDSDSNDDAVSEALAAPEEVEVSPETGEEPAVVETGEEVDGDDDELPEQQEEQFPPETLARYAARYGFTAEQLQANPRLQRLVKDSLNSDIAVRDRETQVEERQEPAQPSPEEQQRQYQERRQRSQSFVGSVVNQVFDAKLMNEMGLGILKAFGADPENMNEEGQRHVTEVAPKIGATLARNLVDGVYSALPHLLLQPDPNRPW